MKTYYMKNLITEEKTETVNVETLEGAQIYFEIFRPETQFGSWILVEELKKKG